MTIKHFALALGISLVAAPVAQAQDNTVWKDLGNWEVSIDPSLDNGCYLLAEWNGGTILRMGNNPQVDNFYFLIGNEKWTSLQPGGSYDIEIKFGNEPVWDVSADGFQFGSGGITYLHAQSTQREFIREFQAALNMRISYNGNEIDILRLDGSRRAWDEVEACQTAMASRANPVDPFAASKDPFANGGQGKNSSAKKKN